MNNDKNNSKTEPIITENSSENLNDKCAKLEQKVDCYLMTSQ